MADLNATAIEAKDDDKAWLIYRDVWAKHSFVELAHEKLFQDRDGQSYLARPGDDQWAAAVEFIGEHQELLEAFRRGGEKPVFGLELKNNIEDYAGKDQKALFPWYDPVPWHADVDPQDPAEQSNLDALAEESVIAVLLPHTQAMRTAARMLVVDTRLAATEGDRVRAIQNIESTFSHARQAAETPVLVAALVGFVVAEHGFQQIEDLVLDYPQLLRDEDLIRLRELVQRQDLRSYVQLHGERAMFYDIVQRSFTDDGDGEGRITRDGLSMLMGIVPALMSGNDTPDGPGILLDLLFASRKEVVDQFDRFVDLVEQDFEKPFFQQPDSNRKTLNEMVDSDSADAYLLSTFVNGFDATREALHRTVARRDAVDAGIAIELFRRESGRVPVSMDELVPEFLKRPPVDPVSGAAMLLSSTDPKRIYSVGRDGVDDGGKQLGDAAGNPRSFSWFNFDGDAKGDWILWPLDPQSR